MKRIEIVAVFKAIEILGKENNMNGIMELVSTVLSEALTKDEKSKPEKSDD